MRKLLVILFCNAFMFAAVPPPSNSTITPEMRAKYWRAQAEAIASATQAREANAKLQSVQSAMVKSCGDLPLVAGKDGEPTCQPKPETA